MEKLTKDEMQEFIGVMITDREYDYLSDFVNSKDENQIQKQLKILANYRYMRLQKMENKINETYEILKKLMSDLFL